MTTRATSASGPPLVTTGRAAAILWTAVPLVALAWGVRAAVVAIAPERVVLHPAPADPSSLIAIALLILVVVGLCLDRFLLYGVGWITAGVVAGYVELAREGAQADYVRVAGHLTSAGDLYVKVGAALLVVGALKVAYGGLTR